MTTILDLEPPAGRLAGLLGQVADDQLPAPTPCAGYSVADLLDHIMALTVGFRIAAVKSAGSPSGRAEFAAESMPGEASAAHLRPDWRSELPRRLTGLAAAWRDPAAWEGITEVVGITLPGDVAGAAAVNELVIHGWDLARATRQPFDCDPGSGNASVAFTSPFAEPGAEASRKGLFGPVVAVPPGAPLLHRALGLAGRDPSWTP